MATITKHIGKMKDAGTRVAIMYRTLPEEKDSALVVSTDNLPSLYHDAFIAMNSMKWPTEEHFQMEKTC